MRAEVEKHIEALKLRAEMFRHIAVVYEIMATSAKECANYLEHLAHVEEKLDRVLEEEKACSSETC